MGQVHMRSSKDPELLPLALCSPERVGGMALASAGASRGSPRTRLPACRGQGCAKED